jgi:hypothetical protein
MDRSLDFLGQLTIKDAKRYLDELAPIPGPGASYAHSTMRVVRQQEKRFSQPDSENTVVIMMGEEQYLKLLSAKQALEALANALKTHGGLGDD